MKTLNELIEAAHLGFSVKFTSDVMKEAAENVIKEKQKVAVQSCQTLILTFDRNLKENVKYLQLIREQEVKQQAKVKKVDRAFKFFAETGNPLPFFASMEKRREGRDWAEHLGLNHQDESAWTIDENWQPKQEASAS